MAEEKAEEPVIKITNLVKEYKMFDKKIHRLAEAVIPKYKKHRIFRAMDELNLEVKKGEILGFLGKNGAGKSTLLKMITGVTFPDEGSVTVKGKVAALLELTAGFSNEMTGRENIYLKGYILGLEDSYIKEIEERIIDFAQLGDYIDQPVRTYSSGMKMRLGFAINVNIEPQILVVDEALAVGDASFKKKCKAKINDIIKSGTTVLFVSHSADSVKEICKRAVYLKKGQVVFDGSTEETLKVYKEAKAAEAEKKKKK